MKYQAVEERKELLRIPCKIQWDQSGKETALREHEPSMSCIARSQLAPRGHPTPTMRNSMSTTNRLVRIKIWLSCIHNSTDLRGFLDRTRD